MTKRLFDILCAIAFLAICSPLFALVAALIRCTSRGPVIYRQTRDGLGGKPFTIYKFRTMLDGSGKLGIDVNSKTDPRITLIGKFLRPTHLDELPQFWNVLRDDMSIVGPRPYRSEVSEMLVQARPDSEKRLCVRPGMTGLAKVINLGSDKSLTGLQHDLVYDLDYTRRRCLWLDLLIMFKTPFVMMKRSGV